MPNPKLLAIITVLTCLGTGSATYAAYTLEQLQEIEKLISSKDCGALRGYLLTYPELTVGNDPLAAELRFFLSAVDNGLVECFSPQVTRSGDLFGIAKSY